jgi:hypothetical protein
MNPPRDRHPPTRFKDYFAMLTECDSEPVTYKEALTDSGWREAMQREKDSIYKNQTWIVVDRPERKNVISTKWIYKLKKDSMGRIVKCKARIVTRGFQQKEGADFFDTFAPVVRWTTIRAIITLAAKKEWDLDQFDFIIAFLNGLIEEDIYMEIPQGFKSLGCEGKVCKLNHALYGLK